LDKMKPVFRISLILALLALVAAFRFASARTAVPGTVNSLNALTSLKKKTSLSCRVPPDFVEQLPDIPPLPGWGSHRWKISTGSDSAQFYFDQGINLYYAFHTLESRASFAKAIRFDSLCAMAYYGKALALGPTINFGNGFRAENAGFRRDRSCSATGRSFPWPQAAFRRSGCWRECLSWPASVARTPG